MPYLFGWFELLIPQFHYAVRKSERRPHNEVAPFSKPTVALSNLSMRLTWNGSNGVRLKNAESFFGQAGWIGRVVVTRAGTPIGRRCTAKNSGRTPTTGNCDTGRRTLQHEQSKYSTTGRAKHEVSGFRRS